MESEKIERVRDAIEKAKGDVYNKSIFRGNGFVDKVLQEYIIGLLERIRLETY